MDRRMGAMVAGSERGQSIVLIALAMFALVAMMGLVLDGGTMYFSRRNSQNASDAAAFAGARILTNPASSGGDVWNAIDSYALANHIANPATDVVAYFLDKYGILLGRVGPSSDRTGATGIVVATTINVPTVFINFVSGRTSSEVRTVAKVQTGRLGGVPVVPMTLTCPQLDTDPENPCGFVKDEPAVLKGLTTGSGNFQWIAYLTSQPDGSCYGANNLDGYLSDPPNPTPPVVNRGDWVCGNTGNSNTSAIRTLLKYWIDQNNISERPWIVPIYDCIGQRGVCDPSATGFNLRYHIVAFGAFVITGFDWTAGPGGNCNGPHPSRYPCSFDEKIPGRQNGQQQYDCQYWDPTKNGGQGAWEFPNECIQGKFIEYTNPGPVDPGPCNLTGLDICGIELIE